MSNGLGNLGLFTWSELPGFQPLDVPQRVRLVRRVRAKLVDVGGALEAVAQRREQIETVDDDRDQQAVDAVKHEVPMLGGDLSDEQLEQVVENYGSQTAAKQKRRKVVVEVEHTSHGCAKRRRSVEVRFWKAFHLKKRFWFIRFESNRFEYLP